MAKIVTGASRGRPTVPYFVDYRDGAGVRHWVPCQTKREAEDRLAEAIGDARQRRGAPALPGTTTVEEYARHWLASVGPTLRRATRRLYEGASRNHIVPALGDLPIRHLGRPRLKAFLGAKLAERHSDGTPRYGRGTVRLLAAVVRAMLEAAVEDRLLLSNPARALIRALKLGDKPGAVTERIKALTRAERTRLLDSAARVCPRYWPVFYVLAYCGLRIGEALALRWSDVDWAAGTLRVRVGVSDRRLEEGPKSAPRTVELRDGSLEVLRRLLTARKAEALRNGWSTVPEWVFCTTVGTRLEPTYTGRQLKRALRTAGLPTHYTLHALRHSYASILLSEGESIQYVQQQLGHSDIRLTVNTYGRWLPVQPRGGTASVAGTVPVELAPAPLKRTPRGLGSRVVALRG